jgi:hypothetical protein
MATVNPTTTTRPAVNALWKITAAALAVLLLSAPSAVGVARALEPTRGAWAAWAAAAGFELAYLSLSLLTLRAELRAQARAVALGAVATAVALNSLADYAHRVPGGLASWVEAQRLYDPLALALALGESLPLAGLAFALASLLHRLAEQPELDPDELDARPGAASARARARRSATTIPLAQADTSAEAWINSVLAEQPAEEALTPAAPAGGGGGDLASLPWAGPIVVASPAASWPREQPYPAPVAVAPRPEVSGQDAANRPMPAPAAPAAPAERVTARNAPKAEPAQPAPTERRYTCKRCNAGGFTFAELGRHARGCKVEKGDHNADA